MRFGTIGALRASHRLCVTGLALLMAAMLVPQPAAADPAWLTAMPAPAKVTAAISGDGNLDTQARRYAAFDRLISCVGLLEGPDEFHPTAAEQAVRTQYVDAQGHILAQLADTLPAANREAQRSKLYQRAFRYESDPTFSRRLASSLIPAQGRRTCVVTTPIVHKLPDQPPPPTKDASAPAILYIGGVALFVLIVVSGIAKWRGRIVDTWWWRR